VSSPFVQGSEQIASAKSALSGRNSFALSAAVFDCRFSSSRNRVLFGSPVGVSRPVRELSRCHVPRRQAARLCCHARSGVSSIMTSVLVGTSCHFAAPRNLVATESLRTSSRSHQSSSIYRMSVVSRTAGAKTAGCRPISHGVTSARRTACGAVACFQVEFAT
jgi:hypothetical protein